MIEETKVLLIDDEEILREMMSMMLASNGYTVVTCKDGKEGVQHFTSGNYDVILTDLVMPKMSGFDVAETVRKFDPHIPIALVTGNALDINVSEVKRRGIDMLLAKPFTYEQLTDLVEDAIKLRETRVNSYSVVA